MNVRFLPIAAAALAMTAGASAEPPKAKHPAPAAEQSHPSPLVLASADQAVGQAPASNQANPAPKHRAMRVTTCRCGDPEAETQEQQ